MKPDRDGPSSPGEWLRRARSNLAIAEAGQPTPEVVLEDLCFDAQQAAEKAIKAVLIHHGLPGPRTHSIADLLSILIEHGVDVPVGVRRSVILTAYSVETRYPSPAEPVTEEEYRQALALARGVVRWAESLAAL